MGVSRLGTTEPAADRARPSREELERALREEQGNVHALAQRYKRDRRQIYRWLEMYALNPEVYRRE